MTMTIKMPSEQPVCTSKGERWDIFNYVRLNNPEWVSVKTDTHISQIPQRLSQLVGFLEYLPDKRFRYELGWAGIDRGVCFRVKGGTFLVLHLHIGKLGYSIVRFPGSPVQQNGKVFHYGRFPEIATFFRQWKVGDGDIAV